MEAAPTLSEALVLAAALGVGALVALAPRRLSPRAVAGACAGLAGAGLLLTLLAWPPRLVPFGAALLVLLPSALARPARPAAWAVAAGALFAAALALLPDAAVGLVVLGVAGIAAIAGAAAHERRATSNE